MRWALLLLIVVGVVALVAAGGPKEGKGHKTKKEMQAKHAEFKENHGKKCHGKKCGSAEKYTKGKNKKVMEEPVDASEAVEAASGRTKREARDADVAPADVKPRKGKKVPSEAKTKKTKKPKKGAEKIDSEPATLEEEVIPAEVQDAKVAKKSKRSADDAGLEEVPLSEKASKGKKKKATEAELHKKKGKSKKAKSEAVAEQPEDSVDEAVAASEDTATQGQAESDAACANDKQCTNEE